MADSFVCVILVLLLSYSLSFFESVPDEVRIIGYVCIFILYDPLLTSLFGGTIGHMMLGLRVRRESDEQKNLSFPRALLRFLLKASLGVISLLTISNNEKGKAIHDYAARSVVMFSKT